MNKEIIEGEKQMIAKNIDLFSARLNFLLKLRNDNITNEIDKLTFQGIIRELGDNISVEAINYANLL